MNVGIIGATGRAGGKILVEAMEQGHEVTAIVRHPARLRNSSIPFIAKGLRQLEKKDVEDFDVLVHAFGSWENEEETHLAAIQHIVAVLRDSAVRLIVVGGAGSLYLDKQKGLRLKDHADFPKSIQAVAEAGYQVLDYLNQSDFKNWEYLSPAEHFIYAGQRTGEFMLAGDELLVNEDGVSEISYADYAIALVDEIENSQLPQRHVSVIAKKKYGLPEGS